MGDHFWLGNHRSPHQKGVFEEREGFLTGPNGYGGSREKVLKNKSNQVEGVLISSQVKDSVHRALNTEPLSSPAMRFSGDVQ